MRQKNCETQTDQEKGNCNAHENKEEDTGIKELENFFDNVDLNASPANPMIPIYLIIWLQVDYKPAIGWIIFKVAIEDKRCIF